MPGVRPLEIRLRPTVADDVPSLFQFQLDPESNRLAGTKPRDHQTFQARWDEILRDPAAVRVTPRVIVEDGVLVGSINISPQQIGTREDVDSIGYWIAREHWGRGIATRAIELMLAEVSLRPLFARAAVHNVASLRALERNGFLVVSRHFTPETQRSVAREMATLRLG